MEKNLWVISNLREEQLEFVELFLTENQDTEKKDLYPIIVMKKEH